LTNDEIVGRKRKSVSFMW